MYIQANIGRNATVIGGVSGPMGDTAWLTFQRETMDAIVEALATALPERAFPSFMADNIDRNGSIGGDAYSAFQVHTGMGEWDGVTEESAHISVYFDTKPGQINAARVQEHLSDALAAVAYAYGQDAIAFVVTDATLALASSRATAR